MRCNIGDTVRTYGIEGTFTVDRLEARNGWIMLRLKRGRCEFPVPVRSIVEVNGKPVPLRSAPIAPPASDYPHEPTFDYDDGPQELQEEAVALWKKQTA